MIRFQYRLIPLSDISFPESRQRAEINYTKVLEYATSITQHGLLQDIGINADSMSLVWGGHRFTAFQLLHDLGAGEETKLTAHYKSDELDSLREAAISAPKTYDLWTKIPTKFVSNASPIMLQVLELSENLNRHDLSWREKAAAVSTIHHQAVKDAQAERKSWSDLDTAKLVGCSRELVTQLLGPERKLAAITDSEVRARAEAAAKQSPTAISASNAVEIVAQRHGHSTKQSLENLIKTKVKPKNDTDDTDDFTKVESVKPVAPPSPIICADFREWAASYSGSKFNFVHCDFPYGINFNKSGGHKTSAANINVGNYDDSHDIYWELLNTLLMRRTELIADSCHLMFWLSMQHLERTTDTIKAVWPAAHISPFPLIWHCSDNSGLLPNPKQEPRRTYEAAIKITLGDRPLAKPTAASFAYPRNSDIKLHRSQKHYAVLFHFFSMFVDSSTRMLDPTCGSGMAVLAARQLGAQSFLGLELDPDMAASATKFFKEATK